MRLLSALQKLYSTSVTDTGDRTYHLESIEPRNYFNLQCNKFTVSLVRFLSIFSFFGGERRFVYLSWGVLLIFVVLGFLPMLLRIFGIKYFCVYY